MFKQASILKLRFNTPKGVLSVEQLWDLSKEELAPLAKNLRKIIKETTKSEDEELGFLETKATPEQTENQLRFNIIKEIYTDKIKAEKDSIEAAQKKIRNERILEAIAKKQDAELEGKSIEELQALLEK